MPVLALLLLVPSSGLAPRAFAQRSDTPAMSDPEIEELRSAAYVPGDRLNVFIKILDSRTKSIQELAGKPRRPGREEDFHDLFEQFTSIANELNDNLDDYGPRHRDMRKQLPKLLQATDRWATALRTPAEDEAYKTARDLALEANRDIHEDVAKLIEEQKSWFAAHPPEKDKPGAHQ